VISREKKITAIFLLNVPVLVLDVQHLFVNLLHGHAASENCGHSQVPTVTGIASGHHVFGVKHLLGQFWDSQRPGK
jgi:hypothetical protein